MTNNDNKQSKSWDVCNKPEKRAAVFTITETLHDFDITLNITSKQYNTYNKYDVRKADLYDVMCELADIFNNVIGIGIDFVVE